MLGKLFYLVMAVAGGFVLGLQTAMLNLERTVECAAEFEQYRFWITLFVCLAATMVLAAAITKDHRRE